MEICRDFPVNDGNIHISGFPAVLEKLIVRLANLTVTIQTSQSNVQLLPSPKMLTNPVQPTLGMT